MILMAKAVNQSKNPKYLPNLYSAWCMMLVLTWWWVQSTPCTTAGGASRARIFTLHHYPVKAEGVFCPPLFTCCHLEGVTSVGCWGPRKPGFLCEKQVHCIGEGRLGSTTMLCCLAPLCLQFWRLNTHESLLTFITALFSHPLHLICRTGIYSPKDNGVKNE